MLSGCKRGDLGDVLVQLDDRDVLPAFDQIATSASELPSPPDRGTAARGESSERLDVGETRGEDVRSTVPELRHAPELMLAHDHVDQCRRVEIELQNSTPRRIAITMSERL